MTFRSYCETLLDWLKRNREACERIRDDYQGQYDEQIFLIRAYTKDINKGQLFLRAAIIFGFILAIVFIAVIA